MAKPTSTTEYIVVTLPWIIIISGVLGNVFGAIILLRKRFRKRSFGIYLLAIACLDTIFLLSNTLFAWGIQILFGIKIQTFSAFGCKLVKYVIVASRAMSAWILVILSLERMLALAIPHLSNTINTRKRAIIGTIIVIIIQGLIYLYNFFSIEIRSWGSCYWSAHINKNRYDIVLNIFDFLNYAVIPSIVMATCNVVLVCLLKHSQELRRSSNRDIKGNVIIIISMSVVFIVLTTPMTVYQILYVSEVDTGPSYVYPILYSLDLLNHAINFVLYCLSGPGFRHEIKVLFHPICKPLRKIRPAEGTDMTSMDLSSPSKDSKSENKPVGEKEIGILESEPKDKEQVRSELVDIPRAPPNLYNDLQGQGQQCNGLDPRGHEGQCLEDANHTMAPGAGSGVQNDENVYCDIDDSKILVDATRDVSAEKSDISLPDTSLTYPKEVYKNPVAVEHWVD